MAKKRRKAPSNITSQNATNTYVKGMVKDFNPSYVPKANWTHARNAANNSVDGDVGFVGNEPANIKCANVPYTIIGAIHISGDQWAVYSTDDTNSEIGLFDDSKCEYTTLVNDPCLSFNRNNLIVGASKGNFDCTTQLYWDDGLNPSRTLNIDNIPYVQIEVSTPGADCLIYEDTDVLDCEQLRLAPLLDTPNIKLTKAIDGGQLRNGTYQAYIAYTENEQKVTDYIGISNLQSLFDHDNTAGALELQLSNLDQDYEFFELVILSNNQNNYVAKKVGLYSTKTQNIGIDFIDPALPSVPIEQIPLRNPAYEKSDAMYVVNGYLIRQGPTEQFDFNYQPLANQIEAKWVVAEYDANYYYKGGNKTGFMRDEQYSFFIRWIYNTGERSASYHIPGRVAEGTESDAAGADQNALSTNELQFQIYNTASVTNSTLSQSTGDGGTIIAKGKMGYWQSTEKYPDQQPEIWNASSNSIWGSANSGHDLCGKYIRHHKMPTEELNSALKLTNDANSKIRILGVEFTNIKRPLNNDGSVIENIIGYELLRGSREGAKSILGKGIFRNMRKYTIQEGSGNVQGLYPNYPYNDLREDVYFHEVDKDADVNKKKTGFKGEANQSYYESIADYPPLQGYTKDVFTFHSPELMFKKPFLNAYETRIYGQQSGASQGQFIKSEQHPQFKLLRNAAIIFASIFGVGYGLQELRGPGNKQYTPTQTLDIGLFGTLPGIVVAPGVTPTGAIGGVAQGVLTAAIDVALDELLDDAVSALDIATGGTISPVATGVAAALADGIMSVVPGTMGGGYNYGRAGTAATEIPSIVKIFQGVNTFLTQFAIGADQIIELFYNMISFEDFVLKHNSVGSYDTFTAIGSGKRFRSRTEDSNFIGSSFTNFGDNGQYKINNLFRPKTIAVNTKDQFDNPTVIDQSRYVIGSLANNELYSNLDKVHTRNISALYGALKYDFENQYGQLDQIKQVPMRGDVELIDPSSSANVINTSAPIFAGDVYIGRYTEKTIMPIFTDFLYGQPDGYSYNYHRRVNIPYPRYWLDSTKYDITRAALAVTSFVNFGARIQEALPNRLYYLDRRSDSTGTSIKELKNEAKDGIMPLFAMKDAYMYSHVNGIQNFFVESEVNLAQRDWEESKAKRHWDDYEYTLRDELFDAQIIKEDNFYRYDYSLSASRFITNLTSFGSVQPRDYDPLVAEKCFSYYPKRLIYSLQAQKEAKKDFWRVFLPNNYKDFKNEVTVIKPISKSGSIIFFPYQSPQMFQGVDQLRTDLGTKLTIGDGGLFSQPMQNIVNSDISNEYGSCESRRCVLNTPMGLFYISQAQGKVFQYAGQLVNIANQGMKWWFNKYLPSQLIKQFSELENHPLGDNPVVGVGCQVIYDINNDIVYFTKRDFKVKEEFINSVSFDPTQSTFGFSSGSSSSNTNLRFDLEDYKNVLGYGYLLPEQKEENFISSSEYPIELGDPFYFEDCSWTVSYDPKAKAWISFHDWHPELCLSSINHFLTTKTIDNDTGDGKVGSIWRHNSRCDLYANYYGVDYPWEVEFTETTGQTVNTVRSLEYQLESYVYKGDLINGCADDRWHDLNYNFDELIVYNSEQVSGKLNLKLSPSFSDASNPYDALQYPIIDPATNSIDILYTKEEQKYRVNQFWDVTKDRGEFTNVPAPAQEVIFVTGLNGYDRVLNAANIDIEKAETQRKKFRHYYNKIILRKLQSNDRKMLLKLNNTKLNLSMR